MKSGRRMKGVLTGIAPLDNRLRGLRGGQLIVLAGATSSGKSALATNIAYNAAQPRLDQGATQPSPGHRVAFFSLEMAAEELATNMMTRETGLASNDIDSGNIEIADFYRLAAAGEKMDRLPLYIDDSATNYVSTIRSKCRREKPALVVIDYLQLMPAAAPDAVFWNDVSRIEQITRGLKLLAKDLNVPVIALSQFSRQTATRENHRPLLSDLRSSGSIENDADIVLLIYREEYWLERNKPDPGKDKEMVEWESRLQACRNKTEIIIAKGRRLGIGSVNLYYDAARCRFDSWPPPADSAGDAFAYQEKLAI
jgi:replicative DNA helicase